MKTTQIALLLSLFCLSAAADNLFFAFDNGVGRKEGWAPTRQAQTLKEVGYAGIGYTGFDDMAARRAAFDAEGIKIFNLYVGCNLDKDPMYDPGYNQAIADLKGSGITLWFTIQGGKPGQDDARAVSVVREVADLAAESGLQIALYPHFGFYVASLDDALRVVAQVDRENVGVTFNLCHELRAGHEARFDELLEKAAPKLFLVSINGADHEGDWDRLIQPLGRGEFDVFPILKKLKALNYEGPIGLQCYNVPGEPTANLTESLAAWKAYQERLKP